MSAKEIILFTLGVLNIFFIFFNLFSIINRKSEMKLLKKENIFLLETTMKLLIELKNINKNMEGTK